MEEREEKGIYNLLSIILVSDRICSVTLSKNLLFIPVPYRLLELLTLPYTYPRHIPFLPYLNCIHLYNGKRRRGRGERGER